GEAGEAGTAGACGPVTREPLDPGSTRHVLPGAPEPTYTAGDPPTSGPHLAGGAVRGVQAEPLPRPVQVAVLEEGGVVIHHRGLSEADRRAVEALAGDDVVVAPHPALATAVVATAWGHRLVCQRVDVAALEAFVADRRGRGPAH
ncbi:MAG: DUF3105 domain-containing protein, partial [Actinomycetota bacterium]|nr:DUF3105 domain-containing protein [Actinomycetota bacterium]